MELGLDWPDFLSIRIDLLYYDRDLLDSSKSRKLLIHLSDVMRDRNEWKKFSNLTGRSIDPHDYAMKNQIRDLELNGYYFGGPVTIYDDGEPVGVKMDQPITIEYKTSPNYFSKLFPFRFLQVINENPKWVYSRDVVGRCAQFLDFHLKNNFDNRLTQYIQFIHGTKAGSADILKDASDLINGWIDLKRPTKTSEKEPPVVEPIEKPTLKQVVLAIYYQQKAGTRELFQEGNKVNSIKDLVEIYNVSQKRFQLEYNKIARKGGESYRLDILRYKKNSDATKKLLGGDQKALNELTREILKARNPVT